MRWRTVCRMFAVIFRTQQQENNKSPPVCLHVLRTCGLCSATDTLGSRLHYSQDHEAHPLPDLWCHCSPPGEAPQSLCRMFCSSHTPRRQLFSPWWFCWREGGGGGRGGGRRGKKEERRREGRKVRKGQAGNWKTKRKQKRAVLDFPTDTHPVIRLHNIFTWTDLKAVLLLLKLWKVCIFPLDVRLIFIIMLLEQLTSVWNDQTDILFTLPAWSKLS